MKFGLSGLAFVLACATTQAHAVGQLVDVQVVDRGSGATLPVYYHDAQYWVAGRPGARYAISVRSKVGERLMAVTSVDGVNVLSGASAGWDQPGYVFSPYRQYQIAGWRKSNSEVAAFEFSVAGDSYAARTGRPDDVGVIGLALFREKLPERPALAPEQLQRKESARTQPGERGLLAPGAPAALASRREAGAGDNPADRASSEASASRQGSPNSDERQAKAMAEPLPTPRLGTGHGQRELSQVERTTFERLQSQPSEIIRIRYDSRENLVASGVIREPLAHRPHPGANPFPLADRFSYVPDPPARQY